MADFTSFALSPRVVERLAAQGITNPTEVQAGAIPAVLSGKDVLLHSQTGTGKTLAYLLPLLERLEPVLLHPQALILVPTQELGIQIRSVAKDLVEGSGLSTAALIGGANPARQAEALKKGPQLLVGTPGRVLEFVKNGRLSLAEIRVAVIDEVDHLVEEGKQKDVEMLLKALPAKAQRVMASATYDKAAEAWAGRWLRQGERVQVASTLSMPETLTHAAFVVDRRDKIVMVRRLLHHYAPEGAIAFVGQGEAIPELVSKLHYHKVNAAGLHGAVKKLDRAATMKDFRSGKLQLLVSSDLTARGLDIGQVSLIMNFDLPTDPEHYVHRAGRTGRMGKAGLVVTLVDPAEAWVLEKYEKALGIHFERPVFAKGEVRERTEDDAMRDAKKAIAREKKAKAKAEGAPAAPAKKKRELEKAPTARQVAKGKAKKAKKKAAGTWKPAARKAASPPATTENA